MSNPPERESGIFNASIETVQATMETNLDGHLRVSQALIPRPTALPPAAFFATAYLCLGSQQQLEI